jgi:ATP-binding cassette subfamily B multidrug efflux pump
MASLSRPSAPPLLSFLRPCALRVASGVLAACAASACFFVTPLVIRQVVETLDAAGAGSTSREAARSALAAFAALLVALAFARALFTYGARWWIIGASRTIEQNLRNAFFAHLQILSPGTYDRLRSGDLLSRAINDIEGVRVLFGVGFLYGAGTQSLALLCLGGMLWISPRLTALALLPLLLSALAMRRMGGWIHRLSTAVQEQLAELSNRAQENFAGARAVKAYAQEANEEAAFEVLNRGVLERNLRLAGAQGVVNAALAILGEAGVAVLIAGGGPAVAGGHLSLGDFVAFTAYQFMLVWPMIALGWILNVVQRGRACWGRLAEVFSERAEVGDEEDAGDAAGRAPRDPAGAQAAAPRRRLAAAPRIAFDRLTFGYAGGPPVLHDVSFAVEPGQWIGIVGRTGSGKSTIAHLLARFYPAPRGSIRIDGTDLNDIPIRVLRDGLGYVPQETFLFSEPLRENIRFGNPEIPEEAVLRAARAAQLTADIERFPERLGQVVGERGVTLSGGQKQRTALARVIAKDPRLVILDDVCSSVDAQTEAAILAELRAFLPGRTTLQIAHRIASVRGADRILVLDGGRIVETGTHDDLMRLGGLYAALADRQALEEAVEKMNLEPQMNTDQHR